MKKVSVKIALKKNSNKNHSWFNNFEEKAIQWWTNSDFFHSEIIIDNTWISAFTKEGIQSHSLKPLKENWEYLDFGEIEVSDEQYSKIIDWINKQENKPYDWKGIFLSQFLSLNGQNNEKWFCSEICCKILQLFLVEEYLDVVPNNMSPGDMYKLSKHRVVKN